ncbi:MAG: AI-2E family transporter, partial [Anaerolineae bacterium]|nr:AI-2E family transporter [Anaerolineae bacterium]
MGLLGDAWLRIPAARRKQLFLLIIAIFVLLIILWAARGVLAPYVIALVFSYLLVPVVDLLEKGWRWVGSHRYLGFLKKIARPLSIVITYLVVIALVVGFFSSFVPLIIEQSKQLWEERDTVWEYLYDFGSKAVAQYELLPAQVQMQIEDALGRLGTAIANVVQQAVGGTAVAISYTVSLVLAIFIIPFWAF